VAAAGSDDRVVGYRAESWRFSLLQKLTGMIDRITTVRVLVVLTLLLALFPAILDAELADRCQYLLHLSRRIIT